MGFLSEAFDAATVEPSTGGSSYPLLPAADYISQIISASVKPTSKEDGELIWCEYEVLDGPNAGAMFAINLNYVNPSVQAQEIGRRQLSAICHAINELNVTDTEQLLFKPHIVALKVKPEQPKKDRETGRVIPGEFWPAKNEFGGAKPIGAAQPAATPAARPVVASQPVTRPTGAATATPATSKPWAASGGTAPWRKGAAS